LSTGTTDGTPPKVFKSSFGDRDCSEFGRVNTMFRRVISVLLLASSDAFARKSGTKTSMNPCQTNGVKQERSPVAKNATMQLHWYRLLVYNRSNRRSEKFHNESLVSSVRSGDLEFIENIYHMSQPILDAEVLRIEA
jgi:hypothetical protein